MKSIGNIPILLVIIVVSLLLIPLALFTEGPVRIIIGSLFLLFFPGYVLISVLFPRSSDPGPIERVALSIGISIAIVPLIGLILNYLPWGIRLIPILVSIDIFIIIVSAIACIRLARLNPQERFKLVIPARIINWPVLNRTDRILTGILLAVVVIALGSLIFIVTNPRQGETFSEFYILGPGEEAKDYPNQITLGESVDFIVGVTNYEHQPTSYRIKVSLNGQEQTEVAIDTIEHGKTVQKTFSIVPESVGADQKIELALYKNDEQTACFDDPLYLYIDVITAVSNIKDDNLSFTIPGVLCNHSG